MLQEEERPGTLPVQYSQQFSTICVSTSASQSSPWQPFYHLLKEVLYLSITDMDCIHYGHVLYLLKYDCVHVLVSYTDTIVETFLLPHFAPGGLGRTAVYRDRV